jgi:putative transposase
MQQAGLKPVWKRKFVHTTNSKHALPIAPNVLARQFNPAAPNVAYASDNTYIRTGAGGFTWLSCSTCSRAELWAGRRRRACRRPWSAMLCAWQSTRVAQRPDWSSIPTAAASTRATSTKPCSTNMASSAACRKGNCWDNAVAERFFLNLKMERVWQRNYANHAEAKLDVANYIARFYSCERLHSVLGNLPPSVYERTMAEQGPITVSEIT